MFFHFPKIDSRDPKKALSAYSWHIWSDEELVELLRREDIVIRDEIFEKMIGVYRSAQGGRRLAFQAILEDPSHPYHARVMQIHNEMIAAEAERKERIRRDRYERILEKDKRDDWETLMSEIKDYGSDYYPLTQTEKYTLGNILYRIVKEHGAFNRDKNFLREFSDMLPRMICVPLIRDHLMEMPVSTPPSMIISAMKEMDLTDEQKREACLRYRFCIENLVTPCEIGKHKFVYFKTIREQDPDDYNRFESSKIYRCEICGKEVYR